MSLMIHVCYTGQNGSARAFAQEMMQSGIVRDIRAEEGCLSYRYFFPAEDPETVLLVDCWRDRAALDRHHKSDLMPKIAALRDKYHLHMKVERFVPEKA